MKTNEHLNQIIKELKKKGIEEKIGLWKRVASDLEKPTKKRIVNLSRINRYTKENETIIVPGKVLASGSLNHKLIIAAFAFSQQAKEKIKKVNGDVITIHELMEKNPKGTNIKIIG